MKMSFGLQLTILTLLIMLGVSGVYGVMPSLIHVHIPYVIAYCFGINLLGHLIVKKGLNTEDFYNYTMAATAVRLFASAGVLFGYFYFFKNDQLLFALNFFVIYFLYLGFDIKTLLSKLRQNS